MQYQYIILVLRTDEKCRPRPIYVIFRIRGRPRLGNWREKSVVEC